MVLPHRSLCQTRNRLVSATALANTQYHALCHSGADEAGDAMRPVMHTDSERLMQEGIATGVEAFAMFQAETGWSSGDLHKTVCHQVGATHRRLSLESFGLSPERDFATLEWLGNTGACALPVTLALAAEEGFLAEEDQVGLLGIGSGINCLLLALKWQNTPVLGGTLSEAPAAGKRGMQPAMG